MGRSVKRFRRYWTLPLGAGIGFIAVAEAILIVPGLITGAHFDALEPGDLISLLSGAVTAAGLIAIFDSFKRVERDAALRLDELYVAFNTPEMRVHRNLAWPYLNALVEDSDQNTVRKELLDRFVQWWVNSDGTAPTGRELGLDDPAPVTDYTWAVTSVINFYVRLENHFDIHFPNGRPPHQEFVKITGPFFWTYWAKSLMTFANLCGEAKPVPQHHGRAVEPYFLKPLRSLDLRHLPL